MKNTLYMLLAAALLAVGGIAVGAGRVTLKDLEAKHKEFKSALAANNVDAAASILASAKAGQLGKLYAGSLVGWQKQLDAARAAAPTPAVTRAPVAAIIVPAPVAGAGAGISAAASRPSRIPVFVGRAAESAGAGAAPAAPRAPRTGAGISAEEAARRAAARAQYAEETPLRRPAAEVEVTPEELEQRVLEAQLKDLGITGINVASLAKHVRDELSEMLQTLAEIEAQKTLSERDAAQRDEIIQGIKDLGGEFAEL